MGFKKVPLIVQKVQAILSQPLAFCGGEPGKSKMLEDVRMCPSICQSLCWRGANFLGCLSAKHINMEYVYILVYIAVRG
jgi:hypothetical protein